MIDNRNGIPTDRRGVKLKIGQIASAEIVIEPKEVKLDGKIWFLGPKVSKICGKVIIVGHRKSIIQPKGEEAKEIENDKIAVIA